MSGETWNIKITVTFTLTVNGAAYVGQVPPVLTAEDAAKVEERLYLDGSLDLYDLIELGSDHKIAFAAEGPDNG